MAEFNIDLDGLLTEVESTYGTDPTPTVSANETRMMQRLHPNISFEEEFPNEREETHTGDLFGAPPIAPLGNVAVWSLPIEAKGSGTVDTPPHWGALAKAVGALETINAATSVVYTPRASSFESVALYGFGGNKRYIGLGGRGTCVWRVPAGDISTFDFTIDSIFGADPTELAVPTHVYGSIAPLTGASVTLTVGAVQLDFEEASFDFGVEVNRTHAGNEAEAIKIRIARYRPTLTVRFKTEAVATYSPWADKRAATTRALQMMLGTAGGERLTLDVASAYVRNIVNEDQDGYSGHAVTWKCMDYTLTQD